MNVLVTGINGLVGGAVARELSKDYDIYGIGRGKSCCTGCKEYIQADIGDKDAVIKCLKQWFGVVFELIVHCAAQISGDADELYHTNCIGTQHVCELAKHMGCRKMVYISSVPVIGRPKRLPVTEEHEVEPLTVYHRTKYFGEMIVAQEGAGYFHAYIFRLASPVGVEMPKERIVRRFLEACMGNEDIHIFGSGNRIQNYIDVDDVANGVRCVAERDARPGLYLLPGYSQSDMELARLCRSVCKGSNSIYVENRIAEEEKWILSGEKAWRELQYKPQKEPKQTLCELMNKWRGEEVDR